VGLRSDPSSKLRWALVALALLALTLKGLTPAGYMIADRGGAFPLVICTGQGPAMSADQDGGRHPPGEHRSHSDGPCAFSGGALTDAPAPFIPARLPGLVFQPERELAKADLLPGRGLAAPPPPSQGPPTLL
jgi:hypothetical protein